MDRIFGGFLHELMDISDNAKKRIVCILKRQNDI